MYDYEVGFARTRKLKNDPLPDTLKRCDGQSLNGFDWRLKRAQHKRADDAKQVELLPDDSLAKACQIQLDVGKLGHVTAPTRQDAPPNPASRGEARSRSMR
jgi:hypothetical protein